MGYCEPRQNRGLICLYLTNATRMTFYNLN
ncbi:hypothetical protein EMIT0324P_170082 [Pseudomonas chlororaphis]